MLSLYSVSRKYLSFMQTPPPQKKNSKKQTILSHYSKSLSHSKKLLVIISVIVNFPCDALFIKLSFSCSLQINYRTVLFLSFA